MRYGTAVGAGASDPAARDLKRPTYVASSNWSIGPLLSRGCLLPTAWGDATELPFFDGVWNRELPVVRGPLPVDWCEQIRGGRRNAFPIAVRVSGSPESVAAGFSLEQVEALLFPTEDDLSMMIDSPFADFDLRSLGLALLVDATAFEGLDREKQPNVSGCGSPDPDALLLADSAAAVRAVVPHVLVGSSDWIRTLESLWDWPYQPGGDGHHLVDVCLRGILGGEDQSDEADLGVHLLRRSSYLLVRRFRAKGGWPAGEILETIEGDLAKESLSEEGQKVIAAWLEKCREILRGTGEVPDLSDAKGVPFRALMYLLMRGGDPETVFRSDRNGGIEVGANVRALAVILAAARTGLRALPAELKSPEAPGMTGRWMAALGRSVLQDLGCVRAEVPFETALRVGGGVTPLWGIRIDGDEAFSVPVFTEAPVLGAIQAAGQLGFSLVDFGAHWAILDDRKQGAERRFRVTTDPAAAAPPSVTVFVVVRDLAPKQRGATAWPSSRARKLTKDQLFGLLERNADPRHPWSVALSGEDQAVVLSERLPVTNDPAETASRLRRIVDDAEVLSSSLSRDWGDT